MKITIDFCSIKTYSDFYEQLKENIDLPDYFGNNLDALYDVISGDVALPLEIHFIKMNLNQLEEFSDLLDTMKELELELEEFIFRYAIRFD